MNGNIKICLISTFFPISKLRQIPSLVLSARSCLYLLVRTSLFVPEIRRLISEITFLMWEMRTRRKRKIIFVSCDLILSVFYFWFWNQRKFLWDWRWWGFDRLISCCWFQNSFFIQLILLFWIRIILSNQNLVGWCPRQHFYPSMQSKTKNVSSSCLYWKEQKILSLFTFICVIPKEQNLWRILKWSWHEKSFFFLYH